MTDQELRDLVASLAVSQKETDRQMKERREEFDRECEEREKSYLDLEKTIREVTEEFFYNCLEEKQILAGIEYDKILKNVAGHLKSSNIKDEYDILLINGNDVAIIETKYKAKKRDLDKLIGQKYENFKKLFSEYRDYNHHLALASFHIDDDLKKEALDNNVIVLQRKGDIIETFKPKNL